MAKIYPTEMTAGRLGQTAALFLGVELQHEKRLDGFKLDFYQPELAIAFEYDGPDHYCEISHVERDLRKDQACERNGIKLRRWPYYFQLTRDVSRHFFGEHHSDDKYDRVLKEVFGVKEEREILAPGLHSSKNTPANFVYRGANRFFKEVQSAPESLRSQVVRSFQIYQQRLLPDRLWLLLPENDERFSAFMKHEPTKAHLNYLFPYEDAGPLPLTEPIES